MKRRRYKGVIARLGPHRGRFADFVSNPTRDGGVCFDVLWAHNERRASYLVVYPGTDGRPYRERCVQARRVGGQIETTKYEGVKG